MRSYVGFRQDIDIEFCDGIFIFVAIVTTVTTVTYVTTVTIVTTVTTVRYVIR